MSGAGERVEGYTGLWWGNLRERDHMGDPDVDGRIILRSAFRKWDVGGWTYSRWLRISTKNQTENIFQCFVIGNPVLLLMQN